MTKNKAEKIGIGRRKTAVASVRLSRGSGKITVNRLPFQEYFASEVQRKTILEPITQCSDLANYNLTVRIKGGGKEAQATAFRLGVSRALVMEDETRRQELKAKGFLTRDPRKKERKKYGLAGARKSFQFSKR